MFNDHDTWFALYAIDGKIDDETYCNKVKHGAFRLHPKSGLGVSEGCITFESPTGFLYLRTILRSAKPSAVPGSTLMAYGIVRVR